MLFSPRPTQSERPDSQYSDFALGMQRPAPPYTFEFHIGGTESGDSFTRIFDILRAHKAKVVSHFGYATGKQSDGFVHSFAIDTSTMDCQVDDLLILFRKLKFVRWAEKAKMSGKAFSNFLFKVTLNNRRSVVLDASAISSLFDSLNAKGRQSDVSAIIREEARNLGREIAGSITGSMKGSLDSQPASVIDWIRGYLQSSGWGLFSFGKDDGVYTFRIADPPISDNGGAQIGIQKYLCGLVLGLIEGVIQTRMDILNVFYSKESRALSIYTGEASMTDTNAVRAADEIAYVAQPTNDAPSAGQRMPGVAFREVRNETSSWSIHSNSDPKQTETITKILIASKKATQKVRIMHAARISFSEANRLIEYLVNAKLLEAKEPDEFGVTSYETTKKGLQLIADDGDSADPSSSA